MPSCEHNRHPVLAGGHAAAGQFVCDQALAECGVVGVDLTSSVGQMRIIPISLRDLLFLPFAERLGGGSENPAGHCNGDSVASKVEDQVGGTSRSRGKIILG